MSVTDKDRNTAIRIARLKAIAEVSREVNGAISAAAEQYISYRVQEGEINYNDDFASRISETINVHMRGVETICSKANQLSGGLWSAIVGVQLAPGQLHKMVHALFEADWEGEKYVNEVISGNE